MTEAFPTVRARPALRIAIVGAESSGKTTLALDLAAALARPGALAAAAGAPRVALVPEVLREWCDTNGRTPRPEEQHGILAEQHRRIEAAAGAHDIVVCDTTALMTHVYSELLFGDDSLREAAIARHRAMAVTLLTALDLPWVADGHQRDGEHVRRPVDDRLRELLQRHGLPFAVVAGRGTARLAQAMAALRPLLHAPPPGPPPAATEPGASPGPRAGLFSRLLGCAEGAVERAVEGPCERSADGAVNGAVQGAVRGTVEVTVKGSVEGSFEGSFEGSVEGAEGGCTMETRAAPHRAMARARRGWVCDCCVPEAELALLRARRDG